MEMVKNNKLVLALVAAVLAGVAAFYANMNGDQKVEAPAADVAPVVVPADAVAAPAADVTVTAAPATPAAAPAADAATSAAEKK